MHRIAIAAVLIPCLLVVILLASHRRRHETPLPEAPASPSLPLPDQAAELRGVSRVIDGDTLEVAGKRVRLEGIDAPESAQTCSRGDVIFRCGDLASQALRSFIGAQELRCVASGSDRYDRLLATCYLLSSAVDIGNWMVSEGFAFAFLRYSSKYLATQEAAAKVGKGLWTSRFEFPWDYRARIKSRAMR